MFGGVHNSLLFCRTADVAMSALRFTVFLRGYAWTPADFFVHAVIMRVIHLDLASYLISSARTRQKPQNSQVTIRLNLSLQSHARRVT